MEYKNIFIDFNDEEWRKERLKKIVDEIYLTLPIYEINKIDIIEDVKGTILFYWHIYPTQFNKNIIDVIVYEDNEACNVKHYKNKCSCHSLPQKEDDEIKKYIKSQSI